mmetsp:Transcript_15138/g.38536  ORF Transcript_15138/g.38536 Transcript_15138/m.38536 type:complete len:254 (+) Transcript_15138:46-807(+)
MGVTDQRGSGAAAGRARGCRPRLGRRLYALLVGHVGHHGRAHGGAQVWRPRRGAVHGVRRHARVPRPVCEPVGHRVHVCRRDRPGGVPQGAAPQHQGRVHRVAREPHVPPDGPRGCGARDRRARGRGPHAADHHVRLDVRDTLPPALPRDPGRRRRDPLGDQVHRRPLRHCRGLRHVQIRRLYARSRQDAEAARGEPRAARVVFARAWAAHAACAHGAPRRERDGGGEDARGSPDGRGQLLPGPAVAPRPRAR